MKFRVTFLPEKEERSNVFFSTLLLFFVVAAFILLKTARDALFLSEYSSTKLPYLMAANTALSTIAAVVYLRIYKAVSLNVLLKSSLLIFAGGTLLFWEELHTALPWRSIWLYLWVGIIGTIAPVGAWTLVARLFSARRGKQWLGVMGGGAILGAIAGGFLARWLTYLISVSSMLPVGSLLLCLALLVSVPLSQSAAEPSPSQEKEDRTFRRRFVTVMLLMVAVGTVVSALIDFQFKSFTQAELQSARKMAAFFGSFYGYLGIASLFFQILITPFLMKVLGIHSTLMLLPLSLLISNGWLLTSPSFTASTVLRGNEELMRHSIDRSSLEVLYMAMPQDTIVQVKSMVDMVAVRLPEGIASLGLIAMFSLGNMPLSVLALINMVLLLLWLVCALFLGRREYPQLLREQIATRDFDVESLKQDLLDHNFYRILPELMKNAERDTVLSLIELIESTGNVRLAPHMSAALRRSEEDIRLKMLRILFSQSSNLSSQVKPLLSDPDRRVRVEAAHYLCYRSGVSKSMLKKFQNDADIAIQIAACAALFSRKVHSASARLTDLLEKAYSSQDAVALKEIAHVLRYVPSSPLHAPLYRRLLGISSNEIQQSTLASIAATKPVEILPDLMKLSTQESLQEQLRLTLAGYGEKMLPFVTNMLEDKHSPVPEKKLVLRAAAEAGGVLSLDFLLRFARSNDLSIRFSAIKSMNRLRQKGLLEAGNSRLVPLIEDELQSLEKEIDRMHSLSVSHHSLLGWLLRERVEWGIERIFRILGLIYDWDFIHTIYRGLESQDRQRADAALDLLENTLDPQLNDRLIALLDRFTSDTSAIGEEEGAVESLLREADPILTAATVQWLKTNELKQYLTKTDLLLRQDPVLEETIAWRLQNMDKDQDGLTTIQKMESLCRLDVFAKSSSPELLVLANHAQEVSYERDGTIFEEGEEADAFYGLVEGEVRLSANHQVETIKPGESFGIAEILANQPRVFSAQAVQRSVCLKIAADVLREVIEESTAVSRGIMELLARRLLQHS